MIKSTDGHTEIFGNGGAGYPIPDQIMLQAPQSCVNSGGSLSVVAAVSYSPRSSQTSGRPFLAMLLEIFLELSACHLYGNCWHDKDYYPPNRERHTIRDPLMLNRPALVHPRHLVLS